MIEVERKYKIANPAELHRKLKLLGARLLGNKTEVDTYYSPPHQTFLGKPRYLRLREVVQGKHRWAQFEYHEAYAHYASKEHEVVVSEPQVLRYILNELGFVPEITVTKRRETWRMKKVQVELDQVRGLGRFIELEVMGQGQHAALGLIMPLVRKLGLTERQRSPGYFKLLLKRQRPSVWRKYYAQAKA